jgi:hypothetical protein
MALDPLREIAVRSSQVRKHRRFLVRNLRLKQARFQAPRRYPRKLAQEPRTPTDRRAPAQVMARGMLQVEAVFTAAAPLTAPVENVPERSALRAHEPLPHAAAERHRP